jgi:hypothetical protein
MFTDPNLPLRTLMSVGCGMFAVEAMFTTPYNDEVREGGIEQFNSVGLSKITKEGVTRWFHKLR